MDEAARDELLIRLDERTGSILKRLEVGDKKMVALDTRVNSLESCEDQRKGTLRVAGVISVVISTCGAMISIMYTVFGGR
jgi:hypothetical protein